MIPLTQPVAALIAPQPKTPSTGSIPPKRKLGVKTPGIKGGNKSPNLGSTAGVAAPIALSAGGGGLALRTSQQPLTVRNTGVQQSLPPRTPTPGLAPLAAAEMLRKSNANNDQRQDPVPMVLDPILDLTSRAIIRPHVPDHEQSLWRPLDGTRKFAKPVLSKGGASF